MSKIPEQEPTLVKNEGRAGDKTYEHPAWGVVQAARVSGLATLFGSAVQHQHYIVLSVGRAQKSVSDLGEERISALNHVRGELVEVAMSEAQWGQLLSSMNVAGGAPCTIQHVGRERQPACPADRFAENFHEAIEAGVREVAADIQALRAELVARFADPKPIGKSERAQIAGKLDAVSRQIEDKLPYVQRVLHEKVEEQVEAAKSDIDGFLQHKLQALGLRGAATPALPTAEVAALSALPASTSDGPMVCTCGTQAEHNAKYGYPISPPTTRLSGTP